MNEIKYINHDTKAEISIPLDKKMIFIYGKNGSGKTTLSRECAKKEEKFIVFNEDYIYNNIYIIDGSGAKQNSETKDKFSSIFINKEEVEIKKQIGELVNIKRELEKEFKNSKEKFRDLISSKIVLDIEENESKKIDNQLKFEYKDYNTQKNNYQYTKKELKTIKTEDDLKTSVEQVNENSLISQLSGKIVSIKLLSEYLNNSGKCIELNNINDKIDCYNTIKDKISEVNRLIESKGIGNEEFSIIKSFVILQEKKINKCLFCGSENIEKALNDWKLIIEDESNQTKEEIIKYIKTNIEDMNSMIIQNKTDYERIVPKTIYEIERFVTKLKNILDRINNEERIEFKISKVRDSIEDLTRNIANLKLEIIKYLFNDFKDKNLIIYCNSVLPQIDKLVNEKNTTLDCLLNNNAMIHSENINKIFNYLDLNKEIELSVDSRGESKKYTLKIKGQEINKLSEGQKHKLALAVFLNQLNNKDLKGKYIVFDDPMISLDEISYHYFKSYLINNKKLIEDKPGLIILTHNFRYLYTQVSNIINNESLTKQSIIYKLFPENKKVLDFELFKLDDISLFKKAYIQMKTKNELTALTRLCYKIFRQFLDISLRINGEPILDNPNEEIKKLFTDTNTIKELTNLSHCLKSLDMDKSPSYEKVKKVMEAFIRSLELLGIHNYLNDIDKRFDSLEDTVKSGETSEIFEIIYAVLDDVLLNDNPKVKDYKNYLSHPRISYTDNILSTSMDI